MQIGAYKCLTPLLTAGSGSARWCVALHEGRRYFLKQFLTPVEPPITSAHNPALRKRQQDRCDAFRERKQALYAALHCVLGDCVVPVHDFFTHEGRFYAASEYIPTPFDTFETIGAVSPRMARELLYSLACCLGKLHTQGIVHADLKPEHIVVVRENDDFRVRLVDFDSGFLESAPPEEARDIEGDPVYLAPETFLCMTGQPAPRTRKVDTFAFGAIAHRLWTGSLPNVVSNDHTYLYEAALAGDVLRLDDRLPTAYNWLIRKSLSRMPEDRPADTILERLLSSPQEAPRTSGETVNGLSRFMKREGWRL